MRRGLFILLGLLIGIVQVSLRGFGAGVIIPNVALISLVLLSARLSLGDLGAVAIAAGTLMELSSGAPAGTQIFGLVLVVLVAKVLLRATGEDSQVGFLYALLLSSTIGYNVVLSLSLPFLEVQQHWWLLMGHTALECLYNSIIFGLAFVLVSRAQRADGGQRRYRLPNH